MVPHHSGPSRQFIGVRIVLAIVLLSSATLFGSNYGFLLYFTATDQTVSYTPTVSTKGGPSGGGDMVAWELVGSPLTIRTITFPTTGCGSSSVPSTWTPYPNTGSSGQIGWTGPMSAPPGSVGNGNYDLYYKITLSDGSSPCGHIIINRQSLKKKK